MRVVQWESTLFFRAPRWRITESMNKLSKRLEQSSEVEALLLFVDIVEAGSLSRAAQLRKKSRAGISYHLAQLEKSLGVQLLRRTTRRIEPTEAGLRLLAHGRTIRGALVAAKESVASLSGELQGHVRVSVPTGFGQLVMSDWMIEFKRRHPGVRLELLFDNRVEDLLRQEVDVAVRVMSEPPPELVARELAAVRHIACASADYAREHGLPAEPQGLVDHPLLTSSVVRRELRVSARRGDERREVALQPTLASENFEFLRKGVLSGLGVGIVPDYVVEADIAAGVVVPALQAWNLSIFGTRLFLLRMPDRYLTLATRALIDFVIAAAREWVARGDALSGRSTTRATAARPDPASGPARPPAGSRPSARNTPAGRGCPG